MTNGTARQWLPLLWLGLNPASQSTSTLGRQPPQNFLFRNGKAEMLRFFVGFDEFFLTFFLFFVDLGLTRCDGTFKNKPNFSIF